MPFSQENRHVTLSLVLILTGLFLVFAGTQAYIAQQDNARRDHKDREYADCLTDFAAELVDTLRAVRESTGDVTDARNRKDAALDRLLVLSQRAQASGAKTNDELPPKLVRAYEATLRERIDAQRTYDRAIREAEKTQRDNPYVSPKVRCAR